MIFRVEVSNPKRHYRTPDHFAAAPFTEGFQILKGIIGLDHGLADELDRMFQILKGIIGP